MLSGSIAPQTLAESSNSTGRDRYCAGHLHQCSARSAGCFGGIQCIIVAMVEIIVLVLRCGMRGAQRRHLPLQSNRRSD